MDRIRRGWGDVNASRKQCLPVSQTTAGPGGGGPAEIERREKDRRLRCFPARRQRYRQTKAYSANSCTDHPDESQSLTFARAYPHLSCNKFKPECQRSTLQDISAKTVIRGENERTPEVWIIDADGADFCLGSANCREY